jgi:signal transduction histidine kinase
LKIYFLFASLFFFFQTSFAIDNAKEFEKTINSFQTSTNNNNLQIIINFIDKNSFDYNQLSRLKIQKSKKIYLDFAKGYYLYSKNNFERASSYFYSIYYSIYETTNNDLFILMVYLYDVEKAIGNDASSLFFLNKIHSLYLESKNIDYLFFYLVEKGVYLRNTKQYDEAIKLFKEAEIIHAKKNDNSSFSWLNLHQGRTYLETADYKTAKYYYDLCFDKYKNSKKKTYLLHILYEYFLLDFYNKDYKNALVKANEMIETANSYKNIDTYTLVPLYYKMGEIYKGTNNKESIYYFERALYEGLKTKQYEGVYDACIRLLEERNNISVTAQKNITAFLSFVKKNKEKELLTKINSSNRLNNILNFENDINEQKKYLIYYIILIFSTFLLLTILMVFYMNQKNNFHIINKQKEELGQQNTILSKFNADINIEYGKIETLNNTLAHDIKSGIISIKEIANKIIKHTNQPQLAVESNKIINETNSLTDTINFLLDNAKHNYSSSIQTEILDWYAILEQSKNSLEHLILLTQPTILFNDNLPNFMGYKTHFYQLFKNLIENSLKYSDPSRDCQISIKIEKSKKNILYIEYEDNGIGIEKENLSKIFDFFNQSKFEHVSKGYGLGLGICKKIVDSYNGKISVTSTPSKGTKFLITMNELITK